MKCQQFELYAAEERVADKGQRFANLTEMQEFVDNLRDTWWWQLWYANVRRVEVGASLKPTESVGGWFASKNSGRIEMASQHHVMMFVLHELAHVLAAARFDSQAHDPQFGRVYTELVYLVMGEQAWLDLQVEFDRAGIEYTHEPEEDGYELMRRKAVAIPMPA